jgi:leader peptidase (prepilin peptidase)/N-methyltransferase
MAGTGAALGWQLIALGLYSGFMIGGVIALGLLLFRRVRRKDAIPLGPFLAVGGIVSMLTGTWFYSFLGMSVSWPWG